MNKKDTIYIDVDDEITAVIHKVINSKSKLVALVLPKRASIFHSSVNLKLLKAKSIKAGKSIVLVSTDANLIGLAGVVGINVAKNLQDKPSIPEVNKEAIKTDSSKDEAITSDKSAKDVTDKKANTTEETEDIEATDQSKSLGEFAALATIGGEPELDDNDVIEFDNDAKKVEDKPKDKKFKIDKKLKVPDFGRFQKILIIAVVAIIVLVVVYVFAFIELPKAKITIKSSTSTLSSTIPLTLDSTQTALNSTDTVVPANMQSVQKTVTSSPVNTTGSKQIGIYATGTVTVTVPSGATSSTDIPAGTVFTGLTSGLTYQSTSDTTISCNPPTPFVCPAGSTKVNVSATQYGTNYNVPSQQYTTNQTSTPGPYNGSVMSGATQPSTVQTVTQADINTANKEIVAPVSATIEQQLEQEITAAGFTPEISTFVAAAPVITDSNTVGTQTNTVTATGNYSYSMYGVHPADLDTVVTNSVRLSSSFNANKQSILDNGSAGATFTVEGSTATSIKVSMDVSSVIGPKLNVAQIKAQSAGQSDAKIINNISSIPGVQSVTIKYSPFWVTAMTHNTKKITVVLEKSNGSAT